MERIDAHHHFWRPARGDYGWMAPDDPILARDHLPEDLAPALKAAGVSRTVLVQAAPTTAETAFLLDLARRTPHVAAVVGWTDFEGACAPDRLEEAARDPLLVGVRPMIQDIADDDWVTRPALDPAFAALVDLDLTFDALALPRHIPRLLARLSRRPELRVVLDHCLKPSIRDGGEGFRDWADGMTALARGTGAFCKLSGLVTEAGPDWTPETLRPYVEHVLEIFGPARVMWGSDWPVVRLRCDYARWLETAEALTSGLAPADRALVFGGTARAFYRLGEGD